jgi:hypothetical protein
MRKKLPILLIVILLFTSTIVPGCEDKGEPTPEPTPGPTPSPAPTPSSTYTTISSQIGGIDPSSASSLAEILGAAQDIEKAREEGTVSGTEAGKLEDELKGKFNSWTSETVDGIDPTKPESIKDFFDLQAVQRTPEYGEHVDPETKQYKEEQMTNKFNEWIRNRVDDIDPKDPGALKDMFDLQVIQRTAKYDELATPDTQNYKEEQMGQKLNDWVRNQVDNIDPADPNSLRDFFWMQKVQANEKYDRFATPETHEYKESEMKRKFNEWVENQVNDLDPNDPDFLQKLEMLRIIQRSDKYDKFIATLMHEWKERTLREKMDQYVENLVNKLNPLSPTFWEDLAKLIDLQFRDVFKEVAAKGTKEYKLTQLVLMLTKPLGPPPMVAGIYPQHGQGNVPLDQSIMIAFDQPMEPGSLEAAIKVSPDTPFAVTPLPDEEFIVLLRPLESLVENTDYTVTINEEAVSVSGIQLLEAYEFSFETKQAGLAPNITATVPQDGTIGNMAGQPITITFNQRMITTSVESAIQISPAFDYSIVWTEGDTTAIVQSHAPLEVNTVYSVIIAEGAVSGDGIPLGEEYKFSFTTGIMNLPRVLGTMPFSGQANIPSNHPIQIVFDRSMDTKSVEDLLKVSPSFEYTTSWFEADMVLNIKPVAALPGNTTYTITVGAGALSSFGLPIEHNYEFSFSTRS